MDDDAAPRAEDLVRFRAEFGLANLTDEDLDLALTHRSYAFEQGGLPDNERLEFLGDALLSSISSEYLYQAYPDVDEGDLSKRRSRLVSRTLLGRRAGQMGLGPLLLLGRGERQSGGARRRSVLGSALEALIGIVYLRFGYETTRTFVRDHVVEPLIGEVSGEGVHGDYKSALQELTQRTSGNVPEYELLEESGPDHAKSFTVEVRLGDRKLARASGPRIKVAENAAARLALEAIGADAEDE